MNERTENIPEPRDIYELLPWYANGTLSPADTARVERALAADPALRESLARVEEERDEAVLFNQSVPAPRAGGIDALMARIEAEAPRRDRVAARETGIVARIVGLFGNLSPRMVAIGAIAAALIIIAEGGALLGMLTRTDTGPGQYITASVEPPALGTQAVLLVSFVETASLDAVSKLLRAEGATIIDGPKAGGLFRISVPAETAETVLADLKTHTDLVRFAAPGK
jgi:anti-sigma factor RsiW